MGLGLGSGLGLGLGLGLTLTLTPTPNQDDNGVRSCMLGIVSADGLDLGSTSVCLLG